jgi:phosphoribosyl-ATP pyrophosphohydrolase
VDAAVTPANIVLTPSENEPVAKQKAKTAKQIQAVETPHRLEKLAAAISEVRQGTRNSPRTQRLLAAGPAKMAQKVVEEAAEVAIEAAIGNREMVIQESVDLIYNLSTLWSALGVELGAIWAEMDRRETLLGMAEKLPKTLDDDV